jgi:outer membrane protein TolC
MCSPSLPFAGHALMPRYRSARHSFARSLPTFALAWLALCVSSAHAQSESGPLTLDEAIAIALADAPEVAASLATLDGAQAVAPSAARLPDPELVAALDNVPVNGDERLSLTRDFMTMQRVGVMQSFPNREKRRLRGARAEDDVAVAAAELRKTRYVTARAVTEAWIGLAVASESLVRLRSLKPDIELQTSAARAALASGRTSAHEALVSQTLAARIDERILALEQEVAMRRAELGRWVGSAAERALASIAVDRPVEHSPESLESSVPEHAPIAPLVARIAAARTDVELARSEKRPDWSAELGYSNRGPDFSDMVSLELRVGLPLFARHRQNLAIAQKLAMVRTEEAQRDAEVRMHTAEVRATFASWQIGQQRLHRYTADILPLGRDRTHAALNSYAAGRGELGTVIDAVSEEINDQLAFVALQGAVARDWTLLHLLHDSATASSSESNAEAAQ